MDPNSLDRITLRAAVEKLSASAAALAEAQKDIDSLLARLDSAQQAEMTPEQTPEHSKSVLIPAISARNLNVPVGTASVETNKWQAPAAAQTIAYPKPQKPAKVKKQLSSEEKIMRAVAIGGGIITVAGVILLVSVAIQRGWLGPLGRVVGAYFIGLILLGAALWLRSKKGRIEAIVALTVTSQIAFIATTCALIFILEWIPEGLGSFIILLGNSAYLLLGRIWSTDTRDQRLPATPAVFLGATLVTGFCALSFVFNNNAWWPTFGIVVALIMSWRISTRSMRIAAAVLGIGIQIFLVESWVATTWPAAAVGVCTAVLLIGLTLWDHPAGGSTAETKAVSKYWNSFNGDPTAVGVGILAPIPISIATSLLVSDHGHPWIGLFLGLVVSCFALFGALKGASTSTVLYQDAAPSSFKKLTAVMAICLVAGSFVMVFGSSLTTRNWMTLTFLVVACLLFMVLQRLPRERQFGVIPWLVWLCAAVFMTGTLLRHVVSLAPLWLTDISALVQALLILAFIGVTILGRRTFYGQPLWLQLLVGLILLTLSATAIVTIVTFMGSLLAGNSGMLLGFIIGHATVSILWMIIAAAVMLSRRLFNVPGALWTGVALALAGTFKLVFFDLVALSGVPRAIAFLLSGIALLAIAALRGRRNISTELVDETPAPTGVL